MDAADWPQLSIGGVKMNWTAVVITALICVTIAFLGTTGNKK